MELSLAPCYGLAAPPPARFVCRVAEIMGTVGWVWSRAPAEFLFCGVTAVWDGGAELMAFWPLLSLLSLAQ